MAKKRKARRSSGVAKRRTRSLSSGGGKKRRRSRGLSEGGTKGKIVNGAKATLGAMVGGGVGVAINKMIPASVGKLGRLGIILGIGIAASYLGAQNMGAGLVGSLTGQTFPNGLLNEDADFADEAILDEDSPLFLDDDGNPMVLDDDGNGGTEYRYLNKDEIEMMERSGAFDDYAEVI